MARAPTCALSLRETAALRTMRIPTATTVSASRSSLDDGELVDIEEDPDDSDEDFSDFDGDFEEE